MNAEKTDGTVKSYFHSIATDAARWANVIEIAARDPMWAKIWYILQDMREIALKGGTTVDVAHVDPNVRSWLRAQGFFIEYDHFNRATMHF